MQRKAIDGDIATLASLLDANDFHPPSISVVLEICTKNLRPQSYRSSLDLWGVLPESVAERNWLCRVIICISVLNATITRATDHMNLDLPEHAENTMLQIWRTQIWPCLSIVSERYILDDAKLPALHVRDPGNGSRNIDAPYALITVCDHLYILNALIIVDLSLEETFRSEESFRTTTSRLLVAYIDMSSNRLFGLSSSAATAAFFHQIMDHSEGINDVFEGSVYGLKLVSGIVAFLQSHRDRSIFKEQGLEHVTQVLHVISSILDQFPTICGAILMLHPDFLQLALKLWQLCITQNIYFSHPREVPPKLIDNAIRRDFTFPSFQIAYLIYKSVGGCAFLRHAVQNHLLRNLYLNCRYWPTTPESSTFHSLTTEYMKELLESFVPFLVHYSVLAPMVRALKRLDRENQRLEEDGFRDISLEREDLPRNKFWRDCFLWTPWKNFRHHVSMREPILLEYRRYDVDVKPPLCGNQMVSRRCVAFISMFTNTELT